VHLIIAGAAAALGVAAMNHAATPFDDAFVSTGEQYGVPPNLLRAIARVESGFNPAAHSSTSDYGLMQINARNLERFNVSTDDALKPEVSIDLAARILAENRTTLGARFNAYTWAGSYNVGPDLLPAAAMEAYAGRVTWHWLLYDIGRLGKA
jgi:soluble lytic murein transglycosylase-like protein